MLKFSGKKVHVIARLSDVKDFIPKHPLIQIGHQNELVVATGPYDLIKKLSPEFITATVDTIPVTRDSATAVTKSITSLVNN